MATLPDPGPAVAVAVSGGPDSTALALLLRDWARDAGCTMTALIVDHGLRAGSGTEAALVARRLSAAAVEAVILHWDGDKPSTGIQARARDARYGLMLDWCRGQGIGSLFVGHHADDQAATVAMRIERGSGLDGIAAMRAVTHRDGVGLYRPLLGVPKADLVGYLAANDLAWVDDPTNADLRHERNRFDRALADHHYPAQHRDRLNRLGARASRASDALQSWTEQVWQACARTGAAGEVTLDTEAFLAVPEEIRLRLLIRAAARAGGHVPGLEKAERTLERLQGDASPTALTLGHAVIRRSGTVLRLVREGRNLPHVDWLPGEETSLNWDGRFRLLASGAFHCPVTVGPGVADTALLPCVYLKHEMLGSPVQGRVVLPDGVQVHARALYPPEG